MADRKLVTCPETGHLEDVALEDTPLGLVVTGCSRFAGDEPACPRECCRRMDRRDREARDTRDRVLLVVGCLDADAARLGSELAESLARDGLVVEVCSLAAGGAPPLEDYHAVVIGARVRFGHLETAVADYIRRHRAELASVPAFFFTVGGRSLFDRAGHARRMTRRTGWHPTAAAAFADAGALQRSDVWAFAREIADEIPSAR
jgi:menaquinone-dependent protoporphyrinogen IX oxidase